jgi:hypothetical protein
MALARPFVILVALAIALAGPSPAAIARGGDGGSGEVRVAGTCDRSATAKLRLRSKDGGIRARFEVDHSRLRGSWRVVLVQNRRVVWRGRRSTRGSGDSFEVERRLPDLPGADLVTGRAWGPGGVTCVATATLPG